MHVAVSDDNDCEDIGVCAVCASASVVNWRWGLFAVGGGAVCFCQCSPESVMYATKVAIAAPSVCEMKVLFGTNARTASVLNFGSMGIIMRVASK